MSKRLKVGDVFTVPAEYVVNPDPSKCYICQQPISQPIFWVKKADERFDWPIHAECLHGEEGRREVLREIAKLSPCNVSSCTFCCGSYEIQTDTWAHKPDCLWLRAKAVKEPADIS